MPHAILLNLQQKIKQAQWVIMTQQMQQAIRLLQMPVMELGATVTEHLEQNPVLEFDFEIDGEEDGESEEEEDLEDQEEPLEKALIFSENDFAILRRLDDDFRPHMSEDTGGRQYSFKEKEYQTFIEQSICTQPTLFEHLMKQAHETFDGEQARAMAEALIGNFNENGFLETPLEEIALLHHFSLERLREVLQKIQTFDPYGVGATTLQESLLNQLRLQGKENSLAATLIKNHYDDLLHHRIPLIQKKLMCTFKEIAHAVDHDLLPLHLHPGIAYTREPTQHLVPDVSLRQEGEQLYVDINHDFIPTVRINASYRKMMEDPATPQETKGFIHKKILAYKWLCRNIQQRGDTIEKIAAALAKRQRAFFLNPDGVLTPLTMKEIAEELGLNESTITRAVNNKYLSSPRGLHPLRFFFSHPYLNEEGETVSSTTVRDMLKNLIENEDKKNPLSDEALSLRLKEQGITCARRTISKYRAELNLGNALQRKKY